MREFDRLHRRIEKVFQPFAPGRQSPGDDSRASARGRNLALLALFILFAAFGLAAAGVLVMTGMDIHSPVTLAAALLIASVVISVLGGLVLRRRKGAGVFASGWREALDTAVHENLMKSRLLATVSHDIRTPLSGIAGMSHLLGQTRLTPEQANYLTGIRQSTAALSQLVDDLLDFVSIEAGRFELRPQEEYVRQFIENVVEMLSHRAHEKGIEIAGCVSREVPALLSFDPARMRQVLYNIIGNAVKFTFDGGVLVRADIDDGDLVISVRDSGPGLTEEDQVRVFSEFEQAGNARDKAAGTGLGLAISRRIVDAAGGTLTVESELNAGSTFFIRIPVSPNVDLAEIEARRTALMDSRVLVVVPAGVTSEALLHTIDALGGECRHATGATAARDILETATRGGPAFTDIIVDHRVADEVSRMLSANPQIVPPGVRRIFLVTPEARAARPMRSGFDSWLIRPLRERSLIGVLQGRMKGIELREPLADVRGAGASRWTQTAAPGIDVLLGEDDPVNRLLLRTVLQKAGHSVREAEDFRTLISGATKLGARPDIIVTDLSMPGGTGLDTLAAIRSFERSHRIEEVPVIVVTGSKGGDIRQQAIDAGATEVLVKPADPVKLTELISSFAQRQAG